MTWPRWILWLLRRPITIDPITLERFMRARGRLRLREFLRWDEATQERSAEIGDDIDADGIYALAQCIVDDGSRLAMLRRVDPVAADRGLVDRALDMAEQGLRNERMHPGEKASVPLGRRA